MTKKRNKKSFNYNKALNNFFIYNNKATGEVGVEIEVEGRNLLHEPITGWLIHDDGSLRGESAEYVFRGPCPRAKVPERLYLLANTLKDMGSAIKESYRTSVHVHLNAREMLVKQIYNQICLYIIFEDVMAYIAGEDRGGNLFCLRARDAEFFLETLRHAIQTDHIPHICNDNMRYSAVNPAALSRHGSLEFRAFRGTTDPDLILSWVNMLLAIKDAAMKFDNPIEIVQAVSTMGPQRFAETVFGADLMANFPKTDWQQSLFEGAQTVQHVAYASDWLPSPVTADTTTVGLEAPPEPQADMPEVGEELPIRAINLILEAGRQANNWVIVDEANTARQEAEDI